MYFSVENMCVRVEMMQNSSEGRANSTGRLLFCPRFESGFCPNTFWNLRFYSIRFKGTLPVKVRELIFKDMGKNLIYTILDDHRDAALYKAAANQFLAMLTLNQSIYYNTDDQLLDCIGTKIALLIMQNNALKAENERLTELVSQLDLHSK